MTHVFVAPHPDDVALSCGGLIASLREVGQNVTIITVYSGGPDRRGENGDLTAYQRAALGFGTKALWPNGETFNRTNIPPDVDLMPTGVGLQAWMADPDRIALTQERANTQARQFWQRAAWTRSANVTNDAAADRPLADTVGGQGTFEAIDFAAADAMTIRRAEEERYVFLMEASVIFLDLPDAVFRGYEGDAQLLGRIRSDDAPPYDLLRQEIVRLEPQMVYFPLAVGGHVDHQLVREVGMSLASERPRWVMPGPDWVGRLCFYEDFPYAWWSDFDGPADLPPGSIDLPRGVELEARYSDISDVTERKAAGIRLYASQIQRLFQSDQGMLDDLAGYHARIGLAGDMGAAAERYWTTVRP